MGIFAKKVTAKRFRYNNHDKQLNIRVTSSMWDKVEEECKKRGCSKQYFISDVLLEKYFSKDPPIGEILEQIII